VVLLGRLPALLCSCALPIGHTTRSRLPSGGRGFSPPALAKLINPNKKKNNLILNLPKIKKYPVIFRMPFLVLSRAPGSGPWPSCAGAPAGGSAFYLFIFLFFYFYFYYFFLFFLFIILFIRVGPAYRAARGRGHRGPVHATTGTVPLGPSRALTARRGGSPLGCSLLALLLAVSGCCLNHASGATFPAQGARAPRWRPAGGAGPPRGQRRVPPPIRSRPQRQTSKTGADDGGTWAGQARWAPPPPAEAPFFSLPTMPPPRPSPSWNTPAGTPAMPGLQPSRRSPHEADWPWTPMPGPPPRRPGHLTWGDGLRPTLTI